MSWSDLAIDALGDACYDGQQLPWENYDVSWEKGYALLGAAWAQREDRGTCPLGCGSRSHVSSDECLTFGPKMAQVFDNVGRQSGPKPRLLEKLHSLKVNDLWNGLDWTEEKRKKFLDAADKSGLCFVPDNTATYRFRVVRKSDMPTAAAHVGAWDSGEEADGFDPFFGGMVNAAVEVDEGQGRQVFRRLPVSHRLAAVEGGARRSARSVPAEVGLEAEEVHRAEAAGAVARFYRQLAQVAERHSPYFMVEVARSLLEAGRMVSSRSRESDGAAPAAAVAGDDRDEPGVDLREAGSPGAMMACLPHEEKAQLLFAAGVDGESVEAPVGGLVVMDTGATCCVISRSYLAAVLSGLGVAPDGQGLMRKGQRLVGVGKSAQEGGGEGNWIDLWVTFGGVGPRRMSFAVDELPRGVDALLGMSFIQSMRATLKLYGTPFMTVRGDDEAGQEVCVPLRLRQAGRQQANVASAEGEGRGAPETETAPREGEVSGRALRDFAYEWSFDEEPARASTGVQDEWGFTVVGDAPGSAEAVERTTAMIRRHRGAFALTLEDLEGGYKGPLPPVKIHLKDVPIPGSFRERPRRIDGEKRAALVKQGAEWKGVGLLKPVTPQTPGIEMGIISNFCMARKRDPVSREWSEWRAALDAKKLNSVTIHTPYATPSPQEMLELLGGGVPLLLELGFAEWVSAKAVGEGVLGFHSGMVAAGGGRRMGVVLLPAHAVRHPERFLRDE